MRPLDVYDCKDMKSHSSSFVTQLLYIIKELFTGKDIGLQSKQASESVHCNFKKFFRNACKVFSCHKDYSRNLIKADVALLHYSAHRLLYFKEK